MTKIHNIIVHHEIWRYDGLFSDWKSRFFFYFFTEKLKVLIENSNQYFIMTIGWSQDMRAFRDGFRWGPKIQNPTNTTGLERATMDLRDPQTHQTHPKLERPTTHNPHRTWESHDPRTVMEPWSTKKMRRTTRFG